MTKTSECYEFKFHKLCESWRKGESPPSLKIDEFPLCVVAVSDCYIERKSIWKENKSSFSLI